VFSGYLLFRLANSVSTW